MLETRPIKVFLGDGDTQELTFMASQARNNGYIVGNGPRSVITRIREQNPTEVLIEGGRVTSCIKNLAVCLLDIGYIEKIVINLEMCRGWDSMENGRRNLIEIRRRTLIKALAQDGIKLPNSRLSIIPEKRTIWNMLK